MRTIASLFAAAAGQRGATPLGSLISAMALVSVGAGVGYVVLERGGASTAELGAVIGTAMDNSTQLVLVRGPVYVQDNGDGIIDGADEISFDIVPVAGSSGVALDGLAVGIIAGGERYTSLPYTATEIGGDGDNVLENRETASVEMTPPAALAPGAGFTIDVVSNGGPTTSVTRTLPQVIDRLMILY
jgi:archaellin